MCFLFGKKKILATQKLLAEKVEELTKETRAISETLASVTATVNAVTVSVNNTLQVSNNAMTNGIRTVLSSVVSNVSNIAETNEKRIVEVKDALNRNLAEIRQDNEKRLNEMREIVEEKLASTINDRLAQTFTTINERLDAVNKGLGEMQNLTSGVTDLKKMLGNIKTRGIFGEVSLSNLLMNILTPEQYEEQFNLSSRLDEGRHIVDFAVVLPGKGRDERVYLPIDAKFPLEDYQRLVSASEIGNAEGVTEASKALTNAIKKQAKSINERYVMPPKTVDFALMYLPIEGLYAEVVRNPGLLEELRSKYKVIPVGPTTISALLNSLQIGFKTLAVQRSSKEIYDIMLKFKSDFIIFISQLEKAQGQVNTVGKTLEDATKRTSIIMKKLEKVEGMARPDDVPEIGSPTNF